MCVCTDSYVGIRFFVHFIFNCFGAMHTVDKAGVHGCIFFFDKVCVHVCILFLFVLAERIW